MVKSSGIRFAIIDFPDPGGPMHRIFGYFSRYPLNLLAACELIGCHTLTQRGVRHFFATKAIESGVHLPCVAAASKSGKPLAIRNWLGNCARKVVRYTQP